MQGLSEQNPALAGQKPRTRRSETPHAGAPELLKNYNRTSAPTADREPGGPRQRADALGPLGPRLRQRVGADAFQAWFVRGEAEIVSQTADTLTLTVSSRFFAEQLRNRFEDDIRLCTGAARIEFVVRLAGSPMERVP